MFLLFGFAPWILCIVAVLLIVFVVLVQLEFWLGSTLMCVASLLALHFLMKVDLLSYITENPSTILLLFGIYLAAGIVWSFVKWISFLYRFKEYREEMLEKFRAEKVSGEQRHARKMAEVVRDLEAENKIRIARVQEPISLDVRVKAIYWEPAFTKTEFEYLKHCYFKNTSDLSKAPSYKDYKAKIVAWVIFWIPSLIGTMFDDFVRKLVTWIVNRFSTLYQTLSLKIVGNFPEPSKKEE